MAKLSTQQRVSLTILVAALGYFVDVFDIQLFGVLRVPSLTSLGLSPAEVTSTGAQLLNWQMGGMMLGGVLWGMLGDKKGRVQVLFGTILLYSIANIANAFVTNIPEYAAARFLTGLGLAGEIGAGITLATELLPKNTRGYATSAIVTCGVMGPVVASFIADMIDWRTAYIGGGVLGLLLFALRISVNESSLFNSLDRHNNVARGKFLMLLSNRKRFLRYVCCITCGVPIWFVISTLAIFAPELGKALGTLEPLKASTTIISTYVGLTLGGLFSGLLSQFFKSRRKIMIIFMFGAFLMSLVIIETKGISAPMFYALMLVNGFFVGYWTLFMTTTAEQFGTNLRATATTTVPNFVRASVILNAFIVTNLEPTSGFVGSVEIAGLINFALALLALWKLPETFGRDMDFVER